jgi:hypothetical protein
MMRMADRCAAAAAAATTSLAKVWFCFEFGISS